MGYYRQVVAIVYKYAALKNLDNQNQKDKWLYKIKYQMRKKLIREKNVKVAEKHEKKKMNSEKEKWKIKYNNKV